MNKRIKRAVIFMMMLTMLFGSLCLFRGVFADAVNTDIIRNDETGIPDRALYQMILKELGKTADSTFTEEEAQNVLNLEQHVFYDDDSDRKKEEQVVSLQGIERCTNLRALRLGRNRITDLKPLEGLKNLVSLGLEYSYHITSIEGLRNLTQLKYLWTPVTVKDLSPVEGMTELTGLSAKCSGIRVLPNLTGHTKLTGFDTRLQGNNLTKKELTAKLPKHIAEDKAWLKQTIDLQEYNVKKMKKTLKVTSPKKKTKITSRTKTIVGKAGKNIWVKFRYPSSRFVDSKWVNGTYLNKNGVFYIKNLNLKRCKKKKLWLEWYYKNSYYNEDVLIKRITVQLKK